MRYPVPALILALVATACGGKTAPSLPSGDSPSAVQVAAGNAQQALPGAVVANTVSVRVINGSGSPVSGVTVAFRVDSGGGSISRNSAQTGSDGSASPGSWTLGTAEGRNVLVATVGSLPPVRIVATAARGVVTIPPQTVGTGGGTIVVNAPGSPVDGLRIEIPSGSYSVPQTVTVTTAPSTALTFPDGIVAAGPIITLRTTRGGYAGKPMYITIPKAVPAGMFTALVVLGPNGPEEILPTLSYNSTSMTAWTRHLDSRLLASGTGASLRDGDDTSLPMVQVYVPVAALYKKEDMDFKIGRDNWEFRPVGTVIAPSIVSGMMHTEAWYFATISHVLGFSGPALNKKYQESDGVEYSNRLGIRWSAVQDMAASISVRDAVRAVAARAGAAGSDEMTAASFLNVRLQMRLYAHPAPVSLLSFGGNGDVDYEADALAIGQDPQSPVRALSLTVPYEPTKELLIAEPAQPGPIHVTFDGVPGNFTAMVAGGTSQSINFKQLETDYAKVVAGTIGDDRFPKYNLMAAWGIDANQVGPVDKTLHYWLGTDSPKLVYAECTTCLGTTRPTQIPAGNGKVAGAAWWATVGGTLWGKQNDGPLLIAKLEGPGTIKAGGELYAFGSDNTLGWLDYVSWNVKRAAGGILPLLPKPPVNQDLAMTMDFVNPPAGLEYFWEFGDGTTAVSATTNATHKWTTSGAKTVTVTARLATTKEPIAREKTTVDVQGEQFAVWRITSASVIAGINPLTETEKVFWGNENRAFDGDTTFWKEISRGDRDGAIVFATKDVPLSIHRGLWMLPSQHTDFATIPPIPSLMIGLADISSTGVSTIDPGLNGKYIESGAMPDNGTIVGLGWKTSSTFANFPSSYSQVSVGINATTASGSIVYTYRQISGTSPTVLKSWSVTVGFNAVRIR